MSALVSKLAARRTPLDEAQKAITEFLAGAAADKITKRQAAVRRLVRYALMPSARRS